MTYPTSTPGYDPAAPLVTDTDSQPAGTGYETRPDLVQHEAYPDTDHGSKLDGGPANQDPITGEPYSHPVGTGLGTAAGGAAAGAIGGAIAGPVGAVVGAVAGGIVGGLAGKAGGEAVNHTDEQAAAYAEADRHRN